MDLDWENITCSDLYNNDAWNFENFIHHFGMNVNSSILSNGKVDPIGNNHWVWYLHANNDNIHIYKFLNCRHYKDEDWIGWRNLWEIDTSPRVKTIIGSCVATRSKRMIYFILWILDLIMTVFCVGYRRRQQIIYLTDVTKSNWFELMLLIFHLLDWTGPTLLFQVIGWIIICPILLSFWLQLLLLFVGISGKAVVIWSLITRLQIFWVSLELLWIMLTVDHVKDYSDSSKGVEFFLC